MRLKRKTKLSSRRWFALKTSMMVLAPWTILLLSVPDVMALLWLPLMTAMQLGSAAAVVRLLSRRARWSARRPVAACVTPRTETLGAIVSFLSLYVGGFAYWYWIVSAVVPQAFSEPLSPLDAMYLAASVFSTTGFGDITPISGAARLLVTAQMVTGVAILGVVLAVAVARAEAKAD